MKKYLKYVLFLLAGLFLGWLFFHHSHPATGTEKSEQTVKKEEIWTCSMHPQIRMHKPGKCPICGMDLIPLALSSAGPDTNAVVFTPDAARLADVMTTVVTMQQPVKEIRLYGKIAADERLLQSQTAHVGGRIESLSVNFTGETVKRGQLLAEVYSPDLVTAQQELLEAAKTRSTEPEIYEAARDKLRQWMLSEDQISSIEKSGIVSTNIPVYSNTTGVVTQKLVNNGDHIAEGSVLYQVADLSKVWVVFDAYESDLAFIHPNDRLQFVVQAFPGEEFSGAVSFIDPVIDPVTRVARVRVEINNPNGRLKPEMFVTGIFKTKLVQSGKQLVIPGSAVLWTGKRSIVYVKDVQQAEPTFQMREVALGPMLGDSYVVTSGLHEGEEIVTRGTFSVDAAAQLQDKPSMMNE